MNESGQGDIIDEFRAAIRLAATESSKTVSEFITSLYDFVDADDRGSKTLTFEMFERGMNLVKSIRKSINRSTLQEIFEECDQNGYSNITVDELIDFCQRSLSTARALSLKLRKVITESGTEPEHYKMAFASMAGSSKYVDVEHFRVFAEDMLNIHIGEADALALYTLYDTNGDGKVSLDDFVGFLDAHTPDAARALNGGNPENIVDIKVSVSRAQDADLVRQGYIQVPPDLSTIPGATSAKPSADMVVAQGTFGKGHSIWIWRAKQGTCCGKLKPIVDIQLESVSYSTAMVVSGYTCLPISLSGQWVWIKRAATIAEEQDSIVDFQVTTGRASSLTDRIWSGPGAGWIRVDGNFSKGFFNSVDTFLWLLPARERSMAQHMASPVRTAVFLSEEERQNRLMQTVEKTLRHYVSLDSMKSSADPFFIRPGINVEDRKDAQKASAINTVIDLGSAPLFHKYSTGSRRVLNVSRFKSMLIDVGLRIDKADYKHIFHFFDLNQDKTITREEFAFMLSLTDYELDRVVDTMKEKLMAVTRGASKIKHNRMIRDIFHIINTDASSILSLKEVMGLCARFNIFLTEEEARQLKALMDVDGDDKVSEKDFMMFMKTRRNVSYRSAQRVKEAAAVVRRWILRGDTGTNDRKRTVSAVSHQWRELELKHSQSYGTKFPGYLVASDFSLILARLGHRLSTTELKQLTMVIAPEQSGRVFQRDIEVFMQRRCRSFGELMHILEEDVLKPVVDTYKLLRKEILQNTSVAESDKKLALEAEYNEMIAEVVKAVQETPKKTTTVYPDDKKPQDIIGLAVEESLGDGMAAQGAASKVKATHNIVSVEQVKDGIEFVIRDYETPQDQMPNLEEWVCMSILTESAVTEEGNYGINTKILVDGICVYIAGRPEDYQNEEEITIDMLCRDLQRMIVDVARTSAPKGGKSLDFSIPFALFDEDGGGTITPDEFHKMLIRLQLIDLLPEGKLPMVLAKFDQTNKGYITPDDFRAFVESGGDVDCDMTDIADDDSDPDDDYGLSSNTPPVTVTRNAELDWLAWFLYKEACKIDSVDPESVITELEAACAESEIIENAGSISKKELWTLLFELKLKGNMTRVQYDKAVHHLAFDNDDKGAESLVDYESLCRYVVRMGRAFNALVQEKKQEREKIYLKMKDTLLKELTSMVSVGSRAGADDKAKSTDDPFGLFAHKNSVMENLRYEKVFRRLDSDGDGKITVREFKSGLRRLRVKDEKRWNLRMIRRLFDDCDKNSDGLLSMKEFTHMINTWKSGGGVKDDVDIDGNFRDSDDEGDADSTEGIFRKEKVIYDNELFKKVSSTLMEVVPSSGKSGENHVEVVKAAVRKFFQRSDPDQRGIVTEERFRAFCRRSSLQETLTASELRTLIERLRKRRPGRSRSGYQSGVVIDYERFLHQLSKTAESIPHSRAEAALAKIQDAAYESAASGRPFLSLCSLVDMKLSGSMTADELIHTVKMMGVAITHEEVRALQELLPPAAVQKDGRIDYRELFWLIQHHTAAPHPGQPADMKKTFDFAPRALAPVTPGATPFFARTPNPTAYGGTARFQDTADFSFGGTHVATPLGDMLTTPLRADHGTSSLAMTRDNPYNSSSSGVHRRQLWNIADRTKYAVDEKSRKWGVPFSLRKQFEVYDSDLTGFVSLRTFQSTLDDLAVNLTPSDLHVLRTQFGRPEDDAIDYLAFCEMTFEDTVRTYGKLPNERPSKGQWNRGAGDTLPPPSRLTETLRHLKNTGKDPLDIFQAYDLDNTGMVDARKFREVVQRLELLQTSRQLEDALEKYASISDRHLISYEDFCRALEAHAASEEGDGRYDRTSPRRRSDSFGRSSKYVDGDGYDGLRSSRGDGRGGTLSSQNIERWYNQDATPREQREFDKVYDSLDRFKSSMDSSFDEGDKYGYRTGGGILPPKPSESVSRLRLNKTSTSWDRTGIASYGSSESPRYRSPGRNSDRLSSSGGAFNAPRSPPSKVGSVMWGSDTPLARKGNAPQLDDSTWVCSVCYFTENSHQSKNCEICQSPNYNNQKDFQIKQQCAGCTFLNGHFAKVCEMCGEKM